MLERIHVMLLSAIVLWTAAAQANAASRPSELPPLVELVVVPPVSEGEVAPPVIATLGQRLRGWFRSSGVVTTYDYAPELSQRRVLQQNGQAGVRVWVVFSDSISQNHQGSAHLYFSVERSANQELKFLWRSVELPSGLDELGVEELVQVIHLASLALWEGTIETSREEVTEQLGRERGALPINAPPTGSSNMLDRPSTDALRAAAAAYGWRPAFVRITQANVSVVRDGQDGKLEPALGIGYLVRWRGKERAATGPELMLGANYWFDRYAVGARVTWQSLFTQEIALTPAAFEVGGSSLRLGGNFTVSLHPSLHFATEIGGGLDIIRYRTLGPTDPQWEVQQEAHDLRPFIYLGAGLQRRMGRLQVGLAALLAVQVRRTRYGFVTGDAYAAQLTPWRVQPGLRLELSWQ